MRLEFRCSSAPEGEAWVDRHGYAAEIRAVAEAVQTQFAKHFADGDAVLLEVIDWLDDEAGNRWPEAGE
jgi:hypothetical protein